MHKRLSGLGAAILLASAGMLSAATFTVVNTNDSGPGSLRQAILDANDTPRAADLIDFDIPRRGRAHDRARHRAAAHHRANDHRRLHPAGSEPEHAASRATTPCC